MLTLWGCAETAASQSRPQPLQPTELEAEQVTDTEHIHKGTGSRKDREAFMAKGERLRGGVESLGLEESVCPRTKPRPVKKEGREGNTSRMSMA